MQPARTDATEDLVGAAEAWASAVEALAAAEEKGRDTAIAREAMKTAGIALYDAVLALRAAQRPADFTGARGRPERRRFKIVELLSRL